MIVRLGWFEAWEAAMCGVLRNLEARRRGRPDTYGIRGDGWGVHIEGAGAERALAKHLGAYWEGVWRQTDRSRSDVAGYQVRSTARENGCLLLHPADSDEAVFVLAVGQLPTFRLAGWIGGATGKRQEWWRTSTGRPAFFVPQSALAGMGTLPPSDAFGLREAA